MMDAYNYIKNCVFVKLKPSNISGVGLFAMKDIPENTPLFEVWTGESGYYPITQEAILDSSNQPACESNQQVSRRDVGTRQPPPLKKVPDLIDESTQQVSRRDVSTRQPPSLKKDQGLDDSINLQKLIFHHNK
jgi:hypothetical protein